MKHASSLALACALLSAGCAAFAQDADLAAAASPETQDCPAPPANDVVDFGPKQQLVLETESGSVSVSVELADEPLEHARGLMFRPALGPKEGMLFDFGDDTPHSMWMKNTCVSLDIVFLKADGRVSGVARHVPPFSERTTPSPGPVRGVLELAAGQAEAFGLLPGDRVIHPNFTGAEPR